MASGQLRPVLRHLRQLVGEPPDELSDQVLLERFATSHDEADFEAILRRHGPLVLGVCRRTLGHEQDAEDAFQATFLVLACKAGSIRKHASLSSWLHGVAYRLSLKARARAARRRTHERRCGAMSAASPCAEPGWDDLRPVLDEELQHLPQAYRAPLILCYLQGKTHAEAAQALGWPLGSMSKRLQRAQQLLRTRLERRGITLSAALLATLAAGAARAAVPPTLMQASLKAAVLAASGQATGAVAPAVLTLMKGGLRTMFYARLCRVGMMMVLGVLLTSGVGLVVGQLAARQDPPPGQQRSADEQSDKAESNANLAFVPADALGFIHVNVHDLWSLPAMKTMREKAGKEVSEALRTMRKNTGVSMEEIQAVTVVILGLEEHRGEPAMVFAVTTTQPYAKEQVVKALGAAQEQQEGKKTYLAARSGGGTALYFLNDRTFIAGAGPAVRQYLSLGKPTSEGPLASALQKANGHHALVAAFHVSTPVRMLLGEAMQRNALPAELRFLAPLQHTRGGTAIIDLADGTARTDVTLRFPDANDAEEAGDAIKVGLNMLRHTLSTGLPPEVRQDKNIAALLDDLAKTLRSAQVKQQKATVQVQLQGKMTPLLAVGLPLLQRTRQASARVASANNLKQMGLAFHNYADTYQHFPAHAIYSKDGKPLLSWRVAILPFVEQQNLYQQFHLDEPWNSEHNKKLLQSMPLIYKPVQGKAGPYETFYRVFVGRGTIFPDKHGSRFADITDGTSNTILIAEAGKAVPWTKPDDLPYSPDKPVPALGGEFGNGFNAAFADGSVHWLPKNIDQTLLRALITCNGGEVIDWSKLGGPAPLHSYSAPRPVPPQATIRR